MKLLVVLLLAAAPSKSLLSRKPWEQGSIYTAEDRAEMELHFQPRESPPFVIEGLPTYDRWAMNEQQLLGDLLFHAPQLLGPRAATFGLSCATCHPGGVAHPNLRVEAASDRPGNVDLLSGYFYPEPEDGVFAPRNISSLRGCASTAPYRRDGAIASLAETNALVVGHEFQQKPPAPWLQALTAYVASFSFLPSPYVDADGRLGERAPAAARAGEAVFAARCASCHVPKTGFTDHAQHELHHGEGKGTLGTSTRFDTQSLRDLGESAPYFFDGSAPTLSSAVELIDRRERLGLTPAERASLTAYLEAVGAVPPPPPAWRPRERIAQALAWSRLLDASDDPALWALCLDAMRLQARLARDEAVARELGAAGSPAEGRVRLQKLRVRFGRPAGGKD